MLRHVGVVVNNVQAQAAFYTQALGLTVLDSKIEQGDYIERLTGVAHARLEWAKLGDDKGMILELLHYHGLTPKESLAVPTAGAGTSHVAFTVKNAEESAQKIHAAGGTCGEILTNPEGTVRVFYAHDPEGRGLEVVQPLYSGGQELRGHSRRHVMENENAFYWFSDPQRMVKMMAHYDLYQKILHVPGAVVETGVFKASTLMRLTAFRKILDTAQRRLVAFDMFGPFPVATGVHAENHYAQTYDQSFGLGLTRLEIMRLLEAKGLQENVTLVEGDICATMPGYFAESALAFVHVDVELYKPTQVIIHECWSRLSPGGLMVFDDYDEDTMAKKAIDEFLVQNDVALEYLPYTKTPVYCMKKA